MSKLNIVKVERNTFSDEKGKEVSYCKFHCLVATPESENSCGYNIESFTTKYDNYDIIKNFVKAGKSVEAEFNYIRQRDGMYKAKLSKIDGIEL